MKRYIAVLGAGIAASAFLASASFVSDAEASVVRRLQPHALHDGADRVVEGRVVAVEARWNASHTGLETVSRIAIDDAHGEVVRVVTPGGELGGMRHVIVGMPVHAVGEHARYFLKENSESTYRVYGWEQGVWPAVEGPRGALFHPPNIASAGSAPDVLHFTHNGMLWNAEQIPVQYRIHEAGSDDISLTQAHDAIFASFAAWQEVPCSSLRFRYEGETTLEMAVDDTNVVMWIESDWIYGAEAAGATSLFFAPGQTPTADVAFNGDNYTWAIGPVSTGTSVQDVQGVLTHELGHFSGLSHTDSSLDTMYVAWTPWQSQRPLSADDKLGLCALYPQAGDECAVGENCSDGSPCIEYEAGALCSPVADPTGTDCNYDRIDCEGFCLFTATNLSTGYCSEFCEVDDDCPDRFACNEASAGAMPVSVCFKDDSSRRPDAGPIDGSCAVSGDCEQGEHCGADGLCTLECREDFDCADPGHVCTGDGRCATPETSGCGCTSGGSSQPLWFLVAALAIWPFRRRRRCARTPHNWPRNGSGVRASTRS